MKSDEFRSLILEDLKSILEKQGLTHISFKNYVKHGGKYPRHSVYNSWGNWSTLMEHIGHTPPTITKALYNDVSKHNKMDLYREFYKHKVMPWCGKYEKKEKNKGIARMLIGSDFHDRDVDSFSLAIFIDTARRLQPDIIVLNGDVFDCPEFSKYDKDPRQMDPKGRFQFVHDEIFAPLREVAPYAQIDLIIGNHEYRLLKYIASKAPYLMPLMSDFMGLSLKDFFKLDDYKINLICKSDLATWTKPEMNKEMKKNFKIYYDAFVCAHECDFGFKMSGTSGHTHTAHLKVEKSINGPLQWLTTPGMVVQDADYVERITKAESGFSIVYIDLETKDVQQKLIITSNSFCEVGAKMYRRKDKKWNKK